MKWIDKGSSWETFRELDGAKTFYPTTEDYANLYTRLAKDCPGCKIQNTSGNMIRSVVQVGDTVYIR